VRKRLRYSSSILTSEAASGSFTGVPCPDAAVLDVNLGNELSFPIADALTAARVPFLFLTAYNTVIPIAHRHRPVIPKPFLAEALVAELARVVAA